MHIALATYDFLHRGLPSSTSTTEAASPSSSLHTETLETTSHFPHTETLVQLCRLWPHLHNAVSDPPPFCHDLLPSESWPTLPDNHDRYSTHYGAGKVGERMVGLELTETGFQYTGRSLSLISVLGGILVILVIIAFISCYKHRKRVANGERFSVELFTTHLRGLQNLSSAQQLQLLGRQADVCPGPPPDYDTVIKQREEEENGLPTYSVAVERRNTVEPKSAFHDEDDYDEEEEEDCVRPHENNQHALVMPTSDDDHVTDMTDDQQKEKTTK